LDRIRSRGVLRVLFKPLEMDFYLSRCGVLIKDFKAFAEELTGRVKAAAVTKRLAQRDGPCSTWLPAMPTSMHS
jgi:hypothetical protein